MARPSKYDWDEIKRHYQSGMLQKDIVRKFKCPRSSLSERAKKWDVNEQAKHVVSDIINVSGQINELNEQDNELARVAIEIGHDRADKVLAINTVAENLLLRINQSIIDNKKVELVKVKQYVDGRVDGETVEPVVVAHGSGDHRAHAEAIDKLAITMGAADRHAPKSDTNVAVQTNVQNNVDIDNMSNTEITKSYLEIIKQ